jgi:hypothetical protein
MEMKLVYKSFNEELQEMIKNQSNGYVSLHLAEGNPVKVVTHKEKKIKKNKT